MSKLQEEWYRISDIINVDIKLLSKTIANEINSTDLSNLDKELLAELIGYKVGNIIAYRATLDVQWMYSEDEN